MKNKTLIFFLFFISCSINKAVYSKNFTISSPDIKNNSHIDQDHVFKGFGCDGKNISPQLLWENAPKETKSFAITVYDPDAPTGSGWWHWMMVNIPSKYDSLSKNFGSKNQFKIQDGIKQIRNDFGVFNFGGPCPPAGDKPHRYIFTIFALDKEIIDVKSTYSPALVGFFINQSTIEKSSFEALYNR